MDDDILKDIEDEISGDWNVIQNNIRAEMFEKSKIFIAKIYEMEKEKFSYGFSEACRLGNYNTSVFRCNRCNSSLIVIIKPERISSVSYEDSSGIFSYEYKSACCLICGTSFNYAGELIGILKSDEVI